MTGLKKGEQLLLDYLVKFAKNRDMNGGQVGVFTGLIGELSACKTMGASWDPSPGYDALLGKKRVSVKTRRRWKDRDRSARIGVFKPDSAGGHNFDLGWYVEIDEEFRLTGIWEASRRVVLRLQKRAGEKRGIPANRFRRAGVRIWPVGSL